MPDCSNRANSAFIRGKIAPPTGSVSARSLNDSPCISRARPLAAETREGQTNATIELTYEISEQRIGRRNSWLPEFEGALGVAGLTNWGGVLAIIPLALAKHATGCQSPAGPYHRQYR